VLKKLLKVIAHKVPTCDIAAKYNKYR